MGTARYDWEVTFKSNHDLGINHSTFWSTKNHLSWSYRHARKLIYLFIFFQQFDEERMGEEFNDALYTEYFWRISHQSFIISNLNTSTFIFLQCTERNKYTRSLKRWHIAGPRNKLQSNTWLSSSSVTQPFK